MPVRYGWRPGSRVNLDAQIAGLALERIQRKHNGVLEPESVVEAARPEASPLHAAFEWDDAAAAQLYRVDQARDMIRSLTVDVSRSNVEPPKAIRAFVNVEVAENRGYVPTLQAMGSADLRRQVVTKAFEELEAWRKRHAELSELARVFSIIDQERQAWDAK